MLAIEEHFIATNNGVFMDRKGAAWGNEAGYCNKKICFVATDKAFLIELLYELSNQPGCYYVKYSTKACDGMYLGRCFFVAPEDAGATWAKYKPHPKLMCSIQDDDFALAFRPQD